MAQGARARREWDSCEGLVREAERQAGKGDYDSALALLRAVVELRNAILVRAAWERAMRP